MLTVDLLAENHRRIYEAVRDAKGPISPKEIEELTGLPGSTVRPTLGVMLEKGLLERPVYGLYTVVALDRVAGRSAPVDEEAEALEVLEELLDMWPVAACLFDLEIRYVVYNAEYLAEWGFPPETDLRGKSLWEVFGDVSGGGEEKFRRVFAGETIDVGLDEPTEWQRDDGTSTYLRIRMMPWAPGGTITGALIICSVGSTPQEAADIRSFGLKGTKYPVPATNPKHKAYVDRRHSNASTSGDDMDVLPQVILPIMELASGVLMDPNDLKEAMDAIKRGEEVLLRVIIERLRPPMPDA